MYMFFFARANGSDEKGPKRSATLHENAISDHWKTPARVPILHFFNTPSAKTLKIQVPKNDVSKVPDFVDEFVAVKRNKRRTLGESAIFDQLKTRARVQISIFATPLMRKR